MSTAVRGNAEHIGIETFLKGRRGRPQIMHIVDPKGTLPVERLADLEELNTETLKDHIGYDESPASLRRALEFLARYGIVHNQKECPNCGNQMTIVKDTADKHHGLVWHCPPCKAKKITKKVRVRDGSFFEKMHLSIRKVLLLAADWVENPGRKIGEVSVEHSVSEDLIGHLHHWFRDLTQQWWERSAVTRRQTLGGPGMVVELCEGQISKGRYSRGPASQRSQALVVGLIEHGSYQVAIEEIDQRTVPNLLTIIDKYVFPGSLIVSDSWSAYGGIGHLQTRHDQHWTERGTEFGDSGDKRIQPPLEMTWERFKRQLTDPMDRLDGQLSCYMFRKAQKNEKILNYLMMEMKRADRWEQVEGNPNYSINLRDLLKESPE